MNVTFETCLLDGCTLRIKDTTQEYGEYLDETSNRYIRKKQFKYSDTYTINVIRYKDKILKIIITPHTSELDEAYYKLEKDGRYFIDHIIIPSLDWYKNQLTNENNILSEYSLIYLTDGVEFYKCIDGNLFNCDSLELASVNPNADTTISKSTQETFSICFLNNCYLNLCNNQISSLIKDRCNNNKIDLFDIELINLALHAIKYNVELGYTENAQAILDDLFTCNNICQQSIKPRNHGCNCGK